MTNKLRTTLLLLSTAAVIASSAPSYAQGSRWMYQTGPGGTPPIMYGDPYGNLYGQRYEAPSYPAFDGRLPTASAPPDFGHSYYEPPVIEYLPGNMPDGR